MKYIFIFIGFTLSFLATSFIYETFVVPRLPEIKSVPVIWWVLCGAPIILVGLFAGWIAKRSVSVIPLSIMSVAGYVTVLQFTGQGFHDIELGTKAHYFQLLVSSMAIFSLIFLIIGVGRVCKVLYLRESTS